MRIDVSLALQYPGQSYPFEGSVALGEMQVLDDPVDFGEARVVGSCVGSGEAISVEAEIAATARTRCARCLTAVSIPLQTRSSEVFARTNGELDPDRYPLDGHFIEMDELVKDALLLELPMRALCAEDCKGLCPSCGLNRNTERCTCQDEGGKRRSPFSALSELLTEDEEV